MQKRLKNTDLTHTHRKLPHFQLPEAKSCIVLQTKDLLLANISVEE